LLIKGMDGYDAIKERQSKMKQNEAKWSKMKQKMKRQKK
jgi:hypothetical protein